MEAISLLLQDGTLLPFSPMSLRVACLQGCCCTEEGSLRSCQNSGKIQNSEVLISLFLREQTASVRSESVTGDSTTLSGLGIALSIFIKPTGTVDVNVLFVRLRYRVKSKSNIFILISLSAYVSKRCVCCVISNVKKAHQATLGISNEGPFGSS